MRKGQSKKRLDSNRKVLLPGESQRDNGTYMYRWTDDQGRHCVYEKTLDKLREKEEEINKKQMLGVRSDSNMTFNDMYEKWVGLKRGIRDSTLAVYKRNYRNHIKDDIGKQNISEIKKSDIKKFTIRLLEEKGLKVSTADLIISVVYQVFEMAVEDNYILSNPAQKVLKEAATEDGSSEPKKRKALEVDEQQHFIDTLLNMERNKKWCRMLLVLLGTGMRIGELTALQWDDIDFENSMINVNKTLLYENFEDGKGYRFEMHPAKRRSSFRQIPMFEFVKQALMTEKQLQNAAVSKKAVSIDGYADFVFRTRNGTPYVEQAINGKIKTNIARYNKTASQNEKLPDFSCHSLRHTFATRLFEGDISAKTVQELLGHKNVMITLDTYTDVTSAHKKYKIKGVEERFMNTQLTPNLTPKSA